LEGVLPIINYGRIRAKRFSVRKEMSIAVGDVAIGELMKNSAIWTLKQIM